MSNNYKGPYNGKKNFNKNKNRPNKPQEERRANSNANPNSNANSNSNSNSKPTSDVTVKVHQGERKRSDYRKPNKFEYRNRPKKKDVETITDIKNDIVRIEKEIELEIREIGGISLGI